MEKREKTHSINDLRVQAKKVLGDRSQSNSDLSSDEVHQLLRELIGHCVTLKEQNDELSHLVENRGQLEDKLQSVQVEANQREGVISALADSSRAVMQQQDFETVARSIFDSCKHLVGAKAGYVALLSDDGTENEVLFLDTGEFVCIVDQNLPMPVRGMREEVYRTRNTLFENNFSENEWVHFLPDGHVGINNVLFAPLVINDTAVGLLGLANKPDGFNKNDVQLASAFGEMAAVALLNNRALEKLQNSEERFRSVAQTANDAIITIDSQGRIVFWNKAAEIIFGYSHDEAVDKSLSFIMPERFRGDHRKGFDRYIKTSEEHIIGSTVEMTGLRKDGSEFPIELSLSSWNFNGDVFFSGIIREITERKRTELEIQSLARFPSENRNPVLRASREGILLYANPASQPLLNLWECQVGQTLPEEWCRLMDDVIRSQETRTENVNCDHRIYSLDITPVVEECYVTLYGKDITERKQMEEALQDQTHALGERVKELNCLYGISALVEKPDITLQEVLQGTVEIIPPGWQYPEITGARILFGEQEFKTENFSEDLTWQQSADIRGHNQRIGSVQVCYLEEREESDEGPFLLEERSLINAIAGRLGRIVERIEAGEALQKAHNELEIRVQERTSELEIANQMLQSEIVERRRAYESEQNARQIADTLRAASQALTATLDMDTVLITLLDFLNRLIPFDSANVALLGDEACLSVRAVRGYKNEKEAEAVISQSYNIEENPQIQDLLSKGKSVLVTDLHRQPGWKTYLELDQAVSWLGVPLVAEEKVIGLCGLDKSEPGFFTQEHLHIAETLIGQATVAIQNAWLFEQVRAGRERLQSLSRRLVEVQESERRYISRELHDEAGQALTSLKVGLHLLERDANRPEAVIASVAELKLMADEILENLHRLAMDLRPASLDYLGLVPALHQYLEAFSDKHNLTVQFETIGFDERLPLDIETALYRIVQEAMTNVIRHAQATRADVILERQQDKLIMIVEDNGVGFDYGSIKIGDRLGIVGMRERAESLRGTFFVERTAGAGTTVLVEVPYDNSRSHRG